MHDCRLCILNMTWLQQASSTECTLTQVQSAEHVLTSVRVQDRTPPLLDYC